MEEITLTQEEFLLFDQDDQFGFFYDSEGYPTANADKEFPSKVATLYQEYDYISVDAQDNIYGSKGGVKKLLYRYVTEAYDIAAEVKEG